MAPRWKVQEDAESVKAFVERDGNWSIPSPQIRHAIEMYAKDGYDLIDEGSHGRRAIRLERYGRVLLSVEGPASKVRPKDILREAPYFWVDILSGK
jgi:hypothetical protein